jgi:hypothetical protein
MDMYQKGEMDQLGRFYPDVICEMVMDAGQRAMDAALNDLMVKHGCTLKAVGFNLNVGCDWVDSIDKSQPVLAQA